MMKKLNIKNNHNNNKEVLEANDYKKYENKQKCIKNLKIFGTTLKRIAPYALVAVGTIGACSITNATLLSTIETYNCDITTGQIINNDKNKPKNTITYYGKWEEIDGKYIREIKKYKLNTDDLSKMQSKEGIINFAKKINFNYINTSAELLNVSTEETQYIDTENNIDYIDGLISYVDPKLNMSIVIFDCLFIIAGIKMECLVFGFRKNKSFYDYNYEIKQINEVYEDELKNLIKRK